MATFTIVEDFRRRLRAWLREEVAVEEEFGSIMRRYRLELWEHMVKCRDMITELEHFVNACLPGGELELLEGNRMKDLEKMRLLISLVK
ncbi:hypothetical protein Tco_1578077 [Tanacetum coccineum]